MIFVRFVFKDNLNITNIIILKVILVENSTDEEDEETKALNPCKA